MWRRISAWQAAAAVLVLAGCASQPAEPPLPRATSAPQVGDSVEQILQRGYLLEPTWLFTVDGHEYVYAATRSEWSNQALILIDGQLACIYAFQSAGSGFQEWEWVAEPDGLTYLASRVRQACGLEPESPSRTLPSLTVAATESPPAGSEGPPVSGLPEVPPIERKSGEAAEMLGTLGKILIGVPIGLIAAPYVIVGGTAALIVGSPFIVAEESAKRQHLEQRAQMRLGLTREETVALLGKPAIEFVLAPVNTSVLLFEAGKDTRYYVGLESERVIWIHDSYPWLNGLAKQAKEAKKQKH